MPPRAPVSSRIALLTGGLVLAAGSAGCLAGLPPLRTDVGAGVKTFPRGETQGNAPETELLGSLHTAFFPAQLVPSAMGRSFDVGAGYGYDGTATGMAMHSLFAEVDAYRRFGTAKNGPIFGLGVAPRLLWLGGSEDPGAGLSLRISADFARTFVDEYGLWQGSSSFGAAGAYGQATFGVYGEASLLTIGHSAFATFTLGLTFRTPTAGFLFF